MPNWCNNTVTLSHTDTAKISDILQVCQKDEALLFQLLRPCPPEQQEDWYNWNVENWGTKWDVKPELLEQPDANTVTLVFETAWSPPLNLYEYLLTQGWSVSAKFHESGAAFVGDFVDGDTDTFEYGNYLEDLDALRDRVPEDLFEWANLEDEHRFYLDNLDSDNWADTDT
jgi:hypothetical protein